MIERAKPFEMPSIAANFGEVYLPDSIRGERASRAAWARQLAEEIVDCLQMQLSDPTPYLEKVIEKLLEEAKKDEAGKDEEASQ